MMTKWVPAGETCGYGRTFTARRATRIGLLPLGYADGYQTDKPSAAGAAPKDVFSLNDDKWSGDHAASDVATTPGMLFSNRLLAENPAIIDIGVTTLARLGVDAPSDFEGVSLLGKPAQAAG